MGYMGNVDRDNGVQGYGTHKQWGTGVWGIWAMGTWVMWTEIMGYWGYRYSDMEYRGYGAHGQ